MRYFPTRLWPTAPPPKSGFKVLAAAHVQALAERGKPKVRIHNGEFRAIFSDEKSFSFNADRVASLLAWLAPTR